MADWVDEETDNVRTTEKWTRDGTKIEFVRLNVSVSVAIGSTYAAGCDGRLLTAPAALRCWPRCAAPRHLCRRAERRDHGLLRRNRRQGSFSKYM
jgi:hypothetical protein